jgi:hypothetical protein
MMAIRPEVYKKGTCRYVARPSRPMDKEGYNGYKKIIGAPLRK